MADAEPPYTIEFYEDQHGNTPFLKWVESLGDTEQRAVVAALQQILAYRGIDVCKSEWGKSLKDGLYELRIRQSAGQIVNRAGVPGADASSDENEKVLLRVFFHAHGQKLILVLGGYDKHERPTRKHQQMQIDLARKRLREWRNRAK